MAKPKPSSARPPGRVFDVRRPGKAPADPSSRPVVIGHKPSAQKAQIAVSGVGEKESKKESLLDAKKKIQIRPGDEDVKVEKAGAPRDISASQKSAETEALAAIAMDGTTERLEGDESDRPAEAEEVEVAKKSVFPAKKAEPAQEESDSELQPTSEAEQSHDRQLDSPEALLEELKSDEIPPRFENQDVVVSHHAGGGTATWKIVCLLVVIVLLGLAAVNILLDAGLVDWSLPHTDLLSD